MPWDCPASACKRSCAATASHHEPSTKLAAVAIPVDHGVGLDEAVPGVGAWRGPCCHGGRRNLLMTPRRWLLAAVTALAASGLLVLGLPACNTPFIPLPPPASPTF